MNWYADGDLGWSLTWFGYNGTGLVPPYGPAGLATFVLDLENGFKVKHRWPTDIEKFRSGKERRISRNDAAQESFDGAAFLLGDQRRDVRATLARYAAQSGATFLLAMPHEQIEVVDVSGLVVTVPTTTKSDWAVLGQRVVCAWLDAEDQTQYTEGTIQAVTATTIALDEAPNADSYVIMPTRPVYFDPQQTFARYPTEAEVWSLAARAADFDYAPALASVPIRDITEFFPPTGAVAYARKFGAVGNTLRLTILLAEGYGQPGEIVSETDTTTTIGVSPGVTTLDDLVTLLESSANFVIGGTFTGTDTIDWDQDELATGGGISGSVGIGETLTTYSGDGTERPVWDREIVGTSVTDSIQAMTQIIDHGAIPYSIGTADEPDWGRAVAFLSEEWHDWQWLKLFFSTTLGPQKAFWLPTWGEDMDFVSQSAGEVIVEVDDLRAWWPYQREHIMFRETDGTLTYAKVTDVVDNGDGTWTLTVDAQPSSDNVDLISWLELCRFGADASAKDFEIEFVFGANGIRLDTIARVVQQ